MINPFCETLDGLFSEMVYYGILKNEDSECFKVDVSISPTFYVLFAAAVVLALINSFVMQAVSQRFRDGEASDKLTWHDQKVAELDDLAEFDGTLYDETTNEQSIHPVPVLFTDRYRWFLHREDAMLSRPPSELSDSVDQESPYDSALLVKANHADALRGENVERDDYIVNGLPTIHQKRVRTDSTSKDGHVYDDRSGAEPWDDDDDDDCDTDIRTVVEL